MSVRAPGSSVAGFVPYSNELILSGIFQKKVITVNYDYPGYRYATQPGVDPADNPLQKNQIFYREQTAPGKYAPLLMAIFHGISTNDVYLFNVDKNKFGSGSAALLGWFDNSAAVFASGTNDRNRYFASIGADDSHATGLAINVLNGAPSLTPEVDTDAIVGGIDAGVYDMINYVIVDQEIDLRTTAKPAAISGDFAIDAIYAARINQRFLNGYDIFPSAFIGALKAANQKLILDNPQI